MLERVARAIYDEAQNHCGDTGGYKDRFTDGLTTFQGGFDLDGFARAALQALREPTEEMQRYASRHVNAMMGCPFDHIDGRFISERAWQAMIDAVLQGNL